MCKRTSCFVILASIQTVFAFLLVPGYIIVTATHSYWALLWQEFFYRSSGICNQSQKACAISNAIYATFNCLSCLAAMTTSIMLAINVGNINSPYKLRILDVWLHVQAIFIFHHILLHIFTFLSIRPGRMSINMIVLLPFMISMLVGILLFVFIFNYYRRIKNEMEMEKELARMESNPIPLMPMQTYAHQAPMQPYAYQPPMQTYVY